MSKKCFRFMVCTMLALGVALTFTGCFGKEDDSNDNTTTTADDTSVVDDAEDAVDDAADAVEEGGEDITNGFDNYDDAHDYLTNRLGQDDNSGQYDVRERDEKEVDIQDGSRGYHFEIYDTTDSSGKKYGDFYVDKDNGKIYKKNTETNKIEEYGNDNQ